jgi:hypothetical protein
MSGSERRRKSFPAGSYPSPIGNILGYYHWPGIWVGRAPGTEPAPLGGENFVLSELQEEVLTGQAADIRFHALREGRFIFDFSNDESRSDPIDQEFDFDQSIELAVRRAEVLNAHVLCLHRALSVEQRLALPKSVVSPIDFISYQSLAPNPDYGWIEQRLTPLLTADSIANYNQLSPTSHDWRLSMRQIVSLTTLEASIDLLGNLLVHEGVDVMPIADLYLRATAFFEAHDYNLALVAAWTIIEALLQSRWERYVDANRTRTIDGVDSTFINAERRARLVSGRDYTASVISETLSLLGEIPHGLYTELDRVRNDRNRFMHALTLVSRASADRALNVAERMLSLVEGLDLAIPRLSRLGG